MKSYSVILFVSLLVVTFAAEELFDGICPVPLENGIENFNNKKYAGEWFEIERYDNTLITGLCGISSIEQKKDKETEYKVEYLHTNLEDTAKPNTTDVLSLKRKLENKNNGIYNLFKGDNKNDIPYQVLDTDYDNYSIVWGCDFKSYNKNIQRLFIYSRKKTLSKELKEKVEAKLTALAIDKGRLKTVQQDDKQCGRNTGSSVVLPTLFTFIFVTILSKQF